MSVWKEGKRKQNIRAAWILILCGTVFAGWASHSDSGQPLHRRRLLRRTHPKSRRPMRLQSWIICFQKQSIRMDIVKG